MAVPYHVRLPAEPGGSWPPDDTEESVVSTNLHQATIWNLRLGLNELSEALTPPGQPTPWYAYTQTAITGFQRPDGSAYTVLPDLFVLAHPIDDQRPSITLAEEGPPLLLIEVLSATTVESNLDLARGKGWTYANGGVAEYLTLDPVGTYVPEQGRGWRLAAGGYVPWEREATGRWQSHQIAAAIAVEGVQVAVYSRDGQRQLREREVNRTLRQQDVMLRQREQQLREKDATLARQAAELATLRRQLERLRKRE
jgi:Uma2 family endonuclease